MAAATRIAFSTECHHTMECVGGRSDGQKGCRITVKKYKVPAKTQVRQGPWTELELQATLNFKMNLCFTVCSLSSAHCRTGHKKFENSCLNFIYFTVFYVITHFLLFRFLANPFPFGHAQSSRSFIGPNKYHHFGGYNHMYSSGFGGPVW